MVAHKPGTEVSSEVQLDQYSFTNVLRALAANYFASFPTEKYSPNPHAANAFDLAYARMSESYRLYGQLDEDEMLNVGKALFQGSQPTNSLSALLGYGKTDHPVLSQLLDRLEEIEAPKSVRNLMAVTGESVDFVPTKNPDIIAIVLARAEDKITDQVLFFDGELYNANLTPNERMIFSKYGARRANGITGPAYGALIDEAVRMLEEGGVRIVDREEIKPVTDHPFTVIRNIFYQIPNKQNDSAGTRAVEFAMALDGSLIPSRKAAAKIRDILLPDFEDYRQGFGQLAMFINEARQPTSNQPTSGRRGSGRGLLDDLKTPFGKYVFKFIRDSRYDSAYISKEEIDEIRSVRAQYDAMYGRLEASPTPYSQRLKQLTPGRFTYFARTLAGFSLTHMENETGISKTRLRRFEFNRSELPEAQLRKIVAVFPPLEDEDSRVFVSNIMGDLPTAQHPIQQPKEAASTQLLAGFMSAIRQPTNKSVVGNGSGKLTDK